MMIQPEELKSIEQKIEDGRNLLTILEQDYLRIQKLHTSEEYALGELSKAKVEITSQLEDITVKRNIIQIDIAKAESEKEILNNDIVAARSTLEAINTETVNIKLDNYERDQIISKKEKELSDKENELNLRETELKSDEDILAKKHGIIRSFKENL